MEENDKELSEGAKSVLALIKSEPVPTRFKTIDPSLAEDIVKVLNEAEFFTEDKMPWLNGIFIDFRQLHYIQSTIKEIQKALEKGSEFENDFWNGVKQSQDARNGFVEALLKAKESGSISFNQKKSEG